MAQRIGELAERFAPDTQWFIDTMNQVRNKHGLHQKCPSESMQSSRYAVASVASIDATNEGLQPDTALLCVFCCSIILQGSQSMPFVVLWSDCFR